MTDINLTCNLVCVCGCSCGCVPYCLSTGLQPSYLPALLSDCLRLSVHPSICLFVCLPACMSVCTSVCGWRPAALACMQEDKQCTFSPETGTAAHVLAASDQPHARETFLDKVERLATLDKQKQDACREATAEHYYAQFSFQPRINARSKRIADVSPPSTPSSCGAACSPTGWSAVCARCHWLSAGTVPVRVSCNASTQTHFM